MIDPNLLRNNLVETAEKLKTRRNFELDIDKLGQLEEQRKTLQVKTETLQAERNARSKSIGVAKARGEDIEPLLEEVDSMGIELSMAKARLDDVQAELNQIALTIPNIPADEVPLGKDDSENKEILRWGTPRAFDFEVKDHVTLGEDLAGLDFCCWRKIKRCAFCGDERANCKNASCLSPIYVGFTYPTTRLSGNLRTLFSEPYHTLWYRPITEIW